jgi:L-lactate dehydrogenase
MNFSIAALTQFATRLFLATGMDADKAASVARLLIQTDAMGRRTHGLAMAPLYLADIEKGKKLGLDNSGMRITGEPVVIKDNGTSAVWDGRYLPGMWLMERAITEAIPLAKARGIRAVAIKQSHHIGCLAALTKIATDQGLIALIANSDPAGARVAPFGGTEALMTPNPLAMGYPTSDAPVLIDICASITTTSMTRQKFANGELFEHEWLLDANGKPTRDPAVLENTTPRGSLQLIGGTDYGHKGFGLSLINEALSQGLTGYGRKDAPKRWGGNTFLQVIDPEMFGGADAFNEQMDFLSNACRSNRPIHAHQPVRMPGDQAARGLAESQLHGISYDDATWQNIIQCATQLAVPTP